MKLGALTLKAGTDYALSYKNNVNAGTATVTITGKGNYTGAVSKTFTIASASIAGAAVSGIANKTYTGSALTQASTVKLGALTLKAGTDYALSYKNNVNAGTATMTITGKGNFTGAVSKTFTIAPAQATPEVTLSKKSFAYNGKVRKPSVTVKVNGAALPESAYTITWPKGLKNVGTYKMKVTLTGNYKGEASASFKIVPKKPVISKVVPVSKGFTVKWKKRAKQTAGFQIQYSMKKNFKKAKKVKVKGAKKTSKKITKLKPKKRYFVRVRAYKKVGKTTYYSAWSKAKYVTTKK